MVLYTAKEKSVLEGPGDTAANRLTLEKDVSLFIF